MKVSDFCAKKNNGRYDPRNYDNVILRRNQGSTAIQVMIFTPSIWVPSARERNELMSMYMN